MLRIKNTTEGIKKKKKNQMKKQRKRASTLINLISKEIDLRVPLTMS